MKNPTPLSWAWFGAVRLERRPLSSEDTHRLLKYHTHSLTRSPSYYLDPPPLPPEDLEPVPDKPVSIFASVIQDSVDKGLCYYNEGGYTVVDGSKSS